MEQAPFQPQLPLGEPVPANEFIESPVPPRESIERPTPPEESIERPPVPQEFIDARAKLAAFNMTQKPVFKPGTAISKERAQSDRDMDWFRKHPRG